MFKKKCTVLPSHVDSKDIAQGFSDYFNQKIDDIRFALRESRSNIPFQEQSSSVAELEELVPVGEQEMKKIILKSNSKCCALDPIPTSLLKSCLDMLLPVICRNVNQSMIFANVPSDFKSAIVTPLIKKASLDKENMKNYRPVSNLPFMSKLLEKVVMCQLSTA